MHRNGFRMAVRKNFRLLKHEHMIYSFEARDLEISNMQLLLLIFRTRDFINTFLFCSYFREV